ncbi:MAG: hypothetical protein LBK58_08580 [Prevotellaceae bacterium]|jgi:hypothetical protein|nr:hypothetical protein [Prevotellaceae bacterium]
MNHDHDSATTTAAGTSGNDKPGTSPLTRRGEDAATGSTRNVEIELPESQIKKIEDLNCYREYNLLISSEKHYIPPLECSLELWFDTRNKITPPQKHVHVLNQFMKIDPVELITALDNLRVESISNHRIIKKSKRIKCLEELELDYILLPRQSRTKNGYVFIYATTGWKILRSEFSLEIEILFKNNKLELVQEHSGLWTRLEWNFEYDIK